MKTRVKTNSKAFLNNLDNYINECIDKDYCQDLNDFYNKFLSEYWHDYNKKYYKGSDFLCLVSYLQGLPSGFNIDFENYRILEIAKEWGTLLDTDNEKKQNTILDNWWRIIDLRILKTK